VIELANDDFLKFLLNIFITLTQQRGTLPTVVDGLRRVKSALGLGNSQRRGCEQPNQGETFETHCEVALKERGNLK
jgi:hypothetical protein